MSKRYVCIHGHFYQPPRENAWLETIDLQESARPFHDWNERINYECYAPNAAARILNEQEQIRKIINNYQHISFNFGPTLLVWLERSDPETYQAILEADRRGTKLMGGHGPAIAQAYSHLIMPLANARDKRTQIKWGIRDFAHRFGRQPEGMWLAETAVDIPTLEELVAQGIRYTILAPRQAKAVRKKGASEWQSVQEYSLDTRRAYRCPLPSGCHIDLFFYDGQIAKAVAFEGLLNSGRSFAERLISGFGPEDEPQLVHIATDGESYGHHHRYGEMALADCLEHLRDSGEVELTVYGEFLEKHPPSWEIQIHENSSWSCVHGVERWRADCGCNSGRVGWHQQWRGPLRTALDELREQLEAIFLEQTVPYFDDPWAVRDDFIEVVLNRSDEHARQFLEGHAGKDLTHLEQIRLLRSLEMQRQAMQMYTSCGWFFDEISGIETIQILQYALRAIHFAQQISGRDLQGSFVQSLEQAPSNVLHDGGEVFRKKVLSSFVDLERVGMHIAASSLFAEYPREIALFNYRADNYSFERIRAGTFSLVFGQSIVKSKITLSEKPFSFVVLHLGQQQMIGHITRDMEPEAFDQITQDIESAFRRPDLNEVIRLMDDHFDGDRFAFSELFNDEKHRIIYEMVERSIQRAEDDLKEIYEDNYQLMSAMRLNNLPIPRTFEYALSFVLNNKMFHFFQQEPWYTPVLGQTVEEMKLWEIEVHDEDALKMVAGQRLLKEVRALAAGTFSPRQIREIIIVLRELEKLPLEVNLWRIQNSYYHTHQRWEKESPLNEKQGRLWEALGEALHIVL